MLKINNTTLKARVRDLEDEEIRKEKLDAVIVCEVVNEFSRDLISW